MAGIRLTESQKRELVEGYRSGKSTISLAESYGCSANTVNRTVKALLPQDEYTALKAFRSRGDLIKNSGISDSLDAPNQKPLEKVGFTKEDFDKNKNPGDKIARPIDEEVVTGIDVDLEKEASGPLALDDADDFGSSSDDDSSNDELPEPDLENDSSSEVFQEIVPLTTSFNSHAQQDLGCESISGDVLPETVYMLVDKTVELDIRLLKDFPELGFLSEGDQERQVLRLFVNQRSAKRHCGRNQRVIKIPNTTIFKLSKPFLLARGVTRLLVDGAVVALDA